MAKFNAYLELNSNDYIKNLDIKSISFVIMLKDHTIVRFGFKSIYKYLNASIHNQYIKLLLLDLDYDNFKAIKRISNKSLKENIDYIDEIYVDIDNAKIYLTDIIRIRIDFLRFIKNKNTVVHYMTISKNIINKYNKKFKK